MANRNDEMKELVREANREFHDRSARDYEQSHQDIFNPGTQQRLSEVLKLISLKAPGGAILDTGCGTGNILMAARGLFNREFGADISFQMCRESRAKSFAVANSDLDLLPFPKETFGAVVAFSVLHHLYDQTQFIREIFRVMKPGGWFYSDHDPNLLNRATWRGRNYNRLYSAISGTSAMDRDDKVGRGREQVDYVEYHHRINEGLDPAGLREIFGQAGFSPVRLIYHDDFSSLKLMSDRRWRLRVVIGLYALLIGDLRCSFLPNLLILARKGIRG